MATFSLHGQAGRGRISGELLLARRGGQASAVLQRAAHLHPAIARNCVTLAL
jgi:hypothetical protein